MKYCKGKSWNSHKLAIVMQVRPFNPGTTTSHIKKIENKKKTSHSHPKSFHLIHLVRETEEPRPVSIGIQKKN